MIDARGWMPVIWLLGAVTLAGCAPAAGQRSPDAGPTNGTARQSVKRIVAAANNQSPVLITKISGRSGGGIGAVEQLVMAGLATTDPDGTPQPRIGEQIPSTDNGLWKVLPDGHMAVTWHLRRDATWQDGTPFTSADLAFTYKVGQDQDLPVLWHTGYSFVESVDAPDPYTVVIRFSQPYIGAATLFTNVPTGGYFLPLPKHMLERAYLEQKDSFLDQSYWTEDYVGTGPYRLQEWGAGSYAIFRANDRYILGRPKIDEIEVRFITDANALVAAILAGDVQLTIGSNVSLDQGLTVRDRWQEGQVEFGYGSWMVIYPQLVNPNPAIIANLEFRRALLQSIDRQEMANTLQAGLVPVAHSYLNPNPLYRELEQRYVVRYEYDLPRARRTLDDLGYIRGPDGVYRDRSGGALKVDISTSSLNPINASAMSAVAGYWRQLGLGVDEQIEPTGGVAYRDKRATRPGFLNLQFSNDVRGLPNLKSSEAPLAENGFVGSNHSRYMNPDLDALVDRFETTIPERERMDILGQIIHHISDQLPVMGLFYSVRPSFWIKTLVGMTVNNDNAATTWNVHEWDLRS